MRRRGAERMLGRSPRPKERAMSTMTEQHSSTATVQAFYGALAAGDVDEVARLCTADVTLHIPGGSPLAGRYDGRDAAIGFLGKMQAATAGTYRAALRVLFANGEQVVAIHHGTATRGEKTLDVDAALLFEVAGGGIAAISAFQTDQDAWDYFFSA
jgi:ketosteroid isomerase-like protein